MKEFHRLKALEGKDYNYNELNDHQVEKLLTANYNMDFLDNGTKFKKARKIIKDSSSN